mgnify:CR=1 FL=1
MSALPVDGMVVIMNRMPADFGTFEPLPGMQTVLVTMLEHPLCSTVDNDQFDCSRQVVEYLLERGHKTVHFISCPERSLSGMRREEGWRETLRAHGIEPPRLIRGDWTAQSGYAAGQALADDPTCTAIYASNDAMAYGCIRGLESRGKRVPEDVSVVGVDDSLGDIVPDRRLTTVRFDNKVWSTCCFRACSSRAIRCAMYARGAGLFGLPLIVFDIVQIGLKTVHGRKATVHSSKSRFALFFFV